MNAARASFIGQSVERREDYRFLTGAGQYTDDIVLPQQSYGYFLRSPHAHAAIRSIETSAARGAPGVLAVFTSRDLAGVGGLPCGWLIKSIDGRPMKEPRHPVLAEDKVRYVGDKVALVVAESAAQAKSAAALIEVDYDVLPAVVDTASAATNRSAVHDMAPDNVCYTWAIGDAAAVDAAFAAAAHVTRLSLINNRLIPNAIEPRAANAAYSRADDSYTLYVTSQNPHVERLLMTAFVLGLPEHKVRVIAPDVGGGFGSKIYLYAEETVLVWAARRVGRPIKWTAERSESFLTDAHGRDHVTTAELALDKDGKFLALRVNTTANLGAYLSTFSSCIPTILYATLLAGQYATPHIYCRVQAVFTNTAPVDAYRGAGRPEATYAIERAVDALARKLGRDPVEIRKLNFIDSFPADIASGLQIDAGDYHASLDKGLEMLDYDAVRAEQQKRRDEKDARQLGIGFSTYVEMCGLAPSRILGALRYGAGGWESITIKVLPTGTVQVLSGTTPHGQGHATTFSQIVADRLGVEVGDVEFLAGDTAVVPTGMDTYGSRSLPVGGVALYHASEKVVEKSRKIAAHTLEVSEDDLEFEEGRFSVKGSPDRGMHLKETAFVAWAAHNLPDGMEPGLEASFIYDPPNFSWPAGCHIAVVEVDTETGDVQLARYVAVDDVGNVINPMIVDGQVHGGIAQGVAQALWEEASYDENGNLLHGSLLNYLVPSAAELPSFDLDRTVTPSPTNPLGVKGVGETGAIASTPAVVNAVIDALSPYGVTDIDMPTSPERVWRAIQEAKA